MKPTHRIFPKPACILLSALSALLLCAPAGAEWKPTPGPLMSRWAKRVSPTRVHPEYPRPQMVRKEWKSLNGLWRLSLAPNLPLSTTSPPETSFDRDVLVPFPIESALSGVMRSAEYVTYRRAFTVPPTGRAVTSSSTSARWTGSVPSPSTGKK